MLRYYPNRNKARKEKRKTKKQLTRKIVVTTVSKLRKKAFRTKLVKEEDTLTSKEETVVNKDLGKEQLLYKDIYKSSIKIRKVR